MYTYIYMLPPSKAHRAEDSDAYSCVKEPLFGKTVIFRMILSLPSIMHQIPTQYAVCDQHSVLLSKSAMVDGNCCIPGKQMLLQEHAAYRLQSALMIFPQVRSSIPAEPYNMWKNAIQPLMKPSLPLVFLV